MLVRYHRTFNKKFIKLTSKLQQKFRERRNLFLFNPHHPLLGNHALGGNRDREWSINITGDYRALYEFEKEDTIVFIDIDTHNKLYGK